MYYHSEAGADGPGRTTPRALPLTPTVALRSLYEQLSAYERLAGQGNRLDLRTHFGGAIRPPGRDVPRPMGDPVFDAIADYASKVVARAGLLSTRAGTTERDRLDEYGRMTRHIFTVEHALAVDLARTVPDLPLRAREAAARAVLALAAYWCDRDRLQGIGEAAAHPLLGTRPADAIGAVLFQHALDALNPTRPTSGGRLGNEPTVDLGIGIGINLARAS